MDRNMIGKIVAIILVVIVLALTIFKSYLINTYDIITMINTQFFTKTPAWLNYMVSGTVLFGLIAFANSFRK